MQKKSTVKKSISVITALMFIFTLVISAFPVGAVTYTYYTITAMLSVQVLYPLKELKAFHLTLPQLQDSQEKAIKSFHGLSSQPAKL